MQRKSGFTLVEILFVVIIAAGILVYAVPSYKRAKDRSTYEAATGILMDIGGAIQALERDLSMDGFDYTFPSNNNKMVSMWEDASSDPASLSRTPVEFIKLAESYGAVQLDNHFQKALFLGHYLEAIPSNTGYLFYAVRNGSSACDGLCADPEVRACMCKSSDTADGCFYGAMYLSDGTIKRIKLDACSN